MQLYTICSCKAFARSIGLDFRQSKVFNEYQSKLINQNRDSLVVLIDICLRCLLKLVSLSTSSLVSG